MKYDKAKTQKYVIESMYKCVTKYLYFIHNYLNIFFFKYVANIGNL